MEFKILGQLEVLDGERIITIRPDKVRTLLAVLVLHANQVVSSERLVQALWGEAPPVSAANTLQGYVSQLRRLLDPKRPGVDNRWLRTRSPGYVLAADSADIDAFRFERLVAEGRRALPQGDAETATRFLTEALSLWRGRALSEFIYDQFAQETIVHLEELREGAIEDRLDAELSLGHEAFALSDLKALAAAAPLRERRWGQLMLALYRTGQQAEALRAYQQLRRTLAEELGIDPSPDLQRLEAAILAQDPGLRTPPQAPRRPTRPALLADRPEFPRRLTGGDEYPLVARAAELASLDAEWHRAVGGEPRLVLIAGEPGVGKTRLAGEAAVAAHERGAVVLFGRCDPDLGIPFQPFGEALGEWARSCDPRALSRCVGPRAAELVRLVPDLGAMIADRRRAVASDPETERYRLFDAVGEWLNAVSEVAPLMLVLDDLQWATRPTLLLLRHVLRWPEPLRLLAVGTYRATEIAGDSAITALVGDLRRDRKITRVTLSGFDDEGVGAFLEHVTGRRLDEQGRVVAQAIHAQTGGNPFFLGEIVRDLREAGALIDMDRAWIVDTARAERAVPEGVRDVVTSRIARLQEATRRMLVIAAVVGDEFDFATLEGTGELGEEEMVAALDEAISSALVTEVGATPPRYRFAHALVRAQIYEDLHSARRGRLHRRIVEALEALHAERLDQHLPELAYHSARGATALAGKAGTYALAAARQALTQLGFEEAAFYVERGLRALETDAGQRDSEVRVKLLLTLAEAKAHILDHASRKQAALLAAEAARAGGDAEGLAWAAFWYSARPVAGVRDEIAIQLCQEAFETLAPGRLDLRAIVLAILASERSFGGDGYGAAPVSEEALALAKRSGDARALALAIFARYDTLWGTHHAHERLLLAEALLATEAITHVVAWMDGRRLRALARLQLGDIEGCRADVEQLAQLAQQRRSRYLSAVVSQWHGVLAMLEGRFTEVEETAAEIPRFAGDDKNLRNVFAAQMFHLRSEQGRLAEFQPLLMAYVEANPGVPGFTTALALTHTQLGHVDEARRLFEGLARCEFASIPRDLLWPGTIASLSEVCAILGDSTSARVLYQLLRPFSGQLIVVGPGTHCPGSADRYLGMLASLNGDPHQSVVHFQDAEALEERIGAAPLLARTRVWFARTLLQRDAGADHETATRLLSVAREATERLGMAQLLMDICVLQASPDECGSTIDGDARFVAPLAATSVTHGDLRSPTRASSPDSTSARVPSLLRPDAEPALEPGEDALEGGTDVGDGTQALENRTDDTPDK